LGDHFICRYWDAPEDEVATNSIQLVTDNHALPPKVKQYKDWLIEQIISGNIVKENFLQELLIREKEQKEIEELHKNKVCPKCSRKRLYYRGTSNNWRCFKCYSLFSYDMLYLGTEQNYQDTLKDYHIVDTNKMVEISDEEIEKKSNEFFQMNDSDIEMKKKAMWKLGAKWYREQLKQKL
jgi:ribosomal protein L37AE/L43A